MRSDVPAGRSMCRDGVIREKNACGNYSNGGALLDARANIVLPTLVSEQFKAFQPVFGTFRRPLAHRQGRYPRSKGALTMSSKFAVFVASLGSLVVNVPAHAAETSAVHTPE